MVRMPLPRPRDGSVIRATASLRLRTPEPPEGGEEVALDRALGEHELVGDLPVRVAHHDEREDLLLPRGERRALHCGAERRRQHEQAGEGRVDGGHDERRHVLRKEHGVGPLGDDRPCLVAARIRPARARSPSSPPGGASAPRAARAPGAARRPPRGPPLLARRPRPCARRQRRSAASASSTGCTRRVVRVEQDPDRGGASLRRTRKQRRRPARSAGHPPLLLQLIVGNGSLPTIGPSVDRRALGHVDELRDRVVRGDLLEIAVVRDAGRLVLRPDSSLSSPRQLISGNAIVPDDRAVRDRRSLRDVDERRDRVVRRELLKIAVVA